MYARTKATRLLSAGTYLDPVYRRAVIRELLKNRFRVVAPSYGYDAVSVLAHALAARRLRRIQWGVVGGSAVALLLLMSKGPLSAFVAAQLMFWVLWGAAYLRRIVTLHLLMTRLKETGPAGGFDGSYPVGGKLTDALIGKIDREQAGQTGLVFYGGFRPFVGAGEPLRDWANAQLLLGAPKNRLAARKDFDVNGSGSGADLDEVERKPVLPFTVRDITKYVAERMGAELRDEARWDERIEGLTVERRRYTTAIRTNDRTVGTGWSQLPGMDDLPAIHWREDYDSAREYLCIRVGSWNEELVTSIFVGFDLKGDTLHTEFYTYVLGPLVRSSTSSTDCPTCSTDGWRCGSRGTWSRPYRAGGWRWRSGRCGWFPDASCRGGYDGSCGPRGAGGAPSRSPERARRSTPASSNSGATPRSRWTAARSPASGRWPPATPTTTSSRRPMP